MASSASAASEMEEVTENHPFKGGNHRLHEAAYGGIRLGGETGLDGIDDIGVRFRVGLGNILPERCLDGFGNRGREEVIDLDHRPVAGGSDDRFVKGKIALDEGRLVAPFVFAALGQEVAQQSYNFWRLPQRGEAGCLDVQGAARFELVAQTCPPRHRQWSTGIPRRKDVGARALSRFEQALRDKHAHGLADRAPADCQRGGKSGFVRQLGADTPSLGEDFAADRFNRGLGQICLVERLHGILIKSSDDFMNMPWLGCSERNSAK